MSFKSAVICFFLIVAANGAKAEVGVTDSKIVIGAHTFESGALAAYASNPRAQAAYYEMINAKGGIFGRKIEFLHEDTAGQWQKASAVTKKLIESDKIFAMVGAMGDMHYAAYKQLDQAGVPDLFFMDAVKGYEPFPKMAFSYSESFAADGKILGDYATKNLKGKRICFITAKTIAEDMPEEAKATIEKFNKGASKADQLPIGLEIKIDKTVPQADAEVSRLKADGCEVVLVDAFGPLAAKIINYADSQKFRPKWLVHYFNNVAQFVSLLNADVRDGIISSTTFARSEAYESPGWKDFSTLMDKKGLPKTGMSAAGYYAAESFTELLRRTGKDLTREKLVKTLEGMGGWQCSICLLPWSYSKDYHWAFKEPVLAVIKNGVWQKYE